jgi:hypothetical protein
VSQDPNDPDPRGGLIDDDPDAWHVNPQRPRQDLDPRDEPMPTRVGGCRVRQTLQIGPQEEAPIGAFRAVFNGRTPLEMDQASYGPGLLSINFVSFATSAGDFESATRDLEIFLVRSSADKGDRQDVWSVPIFKGTVALFLQQFEGGFPVPMDPAGSARFALRTRVGADVGGEPWSILCGLMLTAQNSF